MKRDEGRVSAVAGLVSIVIPCYNPGRYLAEAIESALGQTHSSIEVIVVDDGSTEDVLAITRPSPAVRYLRQPNQGVAAARNEGARASRGRFLVFLDADDRLLPDAVCRGLDVLGTRPAAAFAAGLCRAIGPRGELLPFRQQPEIKEDRYLEMLESNFIWMPGQVVYRREAFASSGGFDSSVDACADYDLYLRLIRQHPIACHRHLVAEYRFHEKNMSADPALMLASALQVLSRQWPHVRKRSAYRHAYAKGRRFWQHYYGSGLVEEIRAGIRTPDARYRAVRGAAILLRHHPVEALRQLGRKLRCVVLDLAGSTR